MNNINYYEDEYYKIKVYNSKFKDLFDISIDYNLENVIVIRKDSNGGWGQNLNLIIRNKVFHDDLILNVGSSEENIKKVFLKINIGNIDNHNHYENDNFKIFYISYDFNDIFKINYQENENILIINRLDNDNDWGQNLKLKYVDKDNNNFRIIEVGSSNSNVKKVRFFEEYDKNVNYYKSNNILITLFENKFNDKFFINFYEDNLTVFIKRIDSNGGWGQNLMLNIFKIEENENYIIYIGSSHQNEIYRKLDLQKRKCFISLSTIPSRVRLPSFIENINHIINNQTYELKYLFITIPKKYKRFDATVDDETIEKLQNIPKVIVIRIENDYGPSSKYLGPLMNYYQVLKNNILVVIDDDRKYSKNLLRNFVIAYNSYSNVTFSSGLWNYYFDKNYKSISEDFLEINVYKEINNNNFYYGQGLGGFFGFAIKVNNLDNFINYNLKILERIPKSFFHDEGIILGYLKYNEEIILYLKHYGCNFIEREMVDALCNSNYVNRGSVEKEILRLTNLENII
jgi:hypothetical protein